MRSCEESILMVLHLVKCNYCDASITESSVEEYNCIYVAILHLLYIVVFISAKSRYSGSSGISIHLLYTNTLSFLVLS